MKQLLNKVKIHNFTYIIMLFSFLAGYFEYMFLFLFIILFHELGHLFAIIIFKYNDCNINIFPFGGLTEYKTHINERIYKELLIAITGPLFQLLLIIIVYLFKECITASTYDKFMYINYLLFSFNFLPIYPLDGGRILGLFLELFFPYKSSLYLNSIISILLSVFFIIVYIIKKDFLIVSIFLLNFLNLINYIKSIKNIYNKFLLERLIYDHNYKQGKTIYSHIYIKKNKKHKINKNNFIYTEKEYLKKYIFNV